MNYKVQAVDITLGNVDVFFTHHEAELPRTSSSAVRRRITECLIGLRDHAGRQGGEAVRARSSVELGAIMRDVLFREHVGPVVMLANELLRDNTQFQGVVLPEQKLSTPKLIASVQAIATAIEPYAAELVSAGLEESFLASMVAAANALRVSSEAAFARRGGRIKSTASLDVIAAVAVRQLRVANRMVRAELPKGSPLLAEWANARRIRRRSAASTAAAEGDVNTTDITNNTDNAEVNTPAAA